MQNSCPTRLKKFWKLLSEVLAGKLRSLCFPAMSAFASCASTLISFNYSLLTASIQVDFSLFFLDSFPQENSSKQSKNTHIFHAINCEAFRHLDSFEILVDYLWVIKQNVWRVKRSFAGFILALFWQKNFHRIKKLKFCDHIITCKARKCSTWFWIKLRLIFCGQVNRTASHEFLWFCSPWCFRKSIGKKSEELMFFRNFATLEDWKRFDLVFYFDGWSPSSHQWKISIDGDLFPYLKGNFRIQRIVIVNFEAHLLKTL